MSQIINASIDLALIDKSQIKTVQKKDGTTGKYLNITVFINDQEDKFGNIASIAISQTKEEREDKAAKVYLGNGKMAYNSEKSAKPKTETTTTSNVNDSDDLPF